MQSEPVTIKLLIEFLKTDTKKADISNDLFLTNCRDNLRKLIINMADQKIKEYYVLAEEKHQANQKLTYRDELDTSEWKKRRDEIVARDNGTCKICNHKPSDFANLENYREMNEEEKSTFQKDCEVDFKQSDLGKEFIKVFNYIPQQASFPMIPKFEGLPTKKIILNVHHKLYVLTRLAWEYKDAELITYCQDCHQTLHDHTKIPSFKDETQAVAFYLTACPKCNGSGHLPEFYYHKNGICFQCNGNKYLEFM